MRRLLKGICQKGVLDPAQGSTRKRHSIQLQGKRHVKLFLFSSFFVRVLSHFSFDLYTGASASESESESESASVSTHNSLHL